MYIFRYEGKIRKIIIDYKFNEKSYIYVTFVNFLLKNKKIFENIKNYDTIIPVPISKKRQKERGYNQSLLIARKIAEKTNLELMNNCLIKTKNIIEQSKLNKEDRLQNIYGVYELTNRQLIENKKILLIDDIYTTGSTVNECSRILRKANPEKIGVLVLAKD
jgi:phosphoribosyltransferase